MPQNSSSDAKIGFFIEYDFALFGFDRWSALFIMMVFFVRLFIYGPACVLSTAGLTVE